METNLSKKLKGIERKIQIPFLVVITVFFLLELINILYGFRFFPVMILEVFIGVYLVKEIIRYAIKKYKDKSKGKDKVKQTRVEEIVGKTETVKDTTKKETKEKDKVGRVIDNVFYIIKIMFKPIFTIFILLLIFDSIGNMGKVSEINDIDLEGNVYECTNLIGDGGACLVGLEDNEEEWVTVIFKEDGSVEHLVEGNELR